MKVILSRKGFDSEYGGYPSIILPDGKMISLPIPSNNDTDFKYSDLRLDENMSVYDVMKQLNTHIKLRKKLKLTKDICCHLDPDLCYHFVNRGDGWRGAFGQINAAQKVLENNNVKEGDLFLFFGWFNDVILTSNGYKFSKGCGRHTIFGYLQIDKIIYPCRDEVPEWLASHPHVKSLRRLANESNCIYIAKETCTFDSSIKGYGMFNYNQELDLTKKGMTRTCWELPDIFRGVSITYHSESSWKDNYFKAACRGQEFVIEDNINIENWAINLIKNYSSNYVKESIKN